MRRARGGAEQRSAQQSRADASCGGRSRQCAAAAPQAGGLDEGDECVVGAAAQVGHLVPGAQEVGQPAGEGEGAGGGRISGRDRMQLGWAPCAHRICPGC